MLNFVVQQGPATLDRCFRALADPTRRSIIERLAAGGAAVGELAAPYDMTLVAVQKHVRALERAGLVETEKVGRTRHCRLVATPMQEAVDWMNRYRMFWEERLEALAELLDEEGST